MPALSLLRYDFNAEFECSEALLHRLEEGRWQAVRRASLRNGMCANTPACVLCVCVGSSLECVCVQYMEEPSTTSNKGGIRGLIQAIYVPPQLRKAAGVRFLRDPHFTCTLCHLLLESFKLDLLFEPDHSHTNNRMHICSCGASSGKETGDGTHWLDYRHCAPK